MKKLPQTFYSRPDPVLIARELLGKRLCTNINGAFTAGIIVETEAYSSTEKACHAHLNKRTKRTEIMFGPPGFAYVYLIYGIYSLFNIVTNQTGKADAILIRAIEPTDGVEEMLLRRNLQQAGPRLTAGPGLLTQALGINTSHYGTDLSGNLIWLEESDTQLPEVKIVASPRVGVGYAAQDALLPWRFRVKDNKWTSKAK